MYLRGNLGKSYVCNSEPLLEESTVKLGHWKFLRWCFPFLVNIKRIKPIVPIEYNLYFSGVKPTKIQVVFSGYIIVLTLKVVVSCSKKCFTIL
jgi:hypothetical protein